MRGLLGLVLLGCSSACKLLEYQIAEDKPLTVLPPNTTWCAGGPRAIAPSQPAEDDGFDVDRDALKRCSRLLYDDAELDPNFHIGSIDFRFEVSEARPLSICVDGGNFGEVAKYVDCVVRVVKGNPPNLSKGKHRWRLTFILD